MLEYIYVLGADGKPQMPTKRRRHVRKLLNTGKARIAEHVPFTIQLLYDNEPILQPIVMAEDPGRTNIGTAAVGLKGQLYFAAVVETRNKEIRRLMDKRRACRRASRNGERKARQRRAKRFGTMLNAGRIMRKLPQYGENGFITCNIIRNTEAPHGAGRIMSRGQAKERIPMEEFKKSMEGIFTTSVCQATLDEAPQAYKPMQEIMKNIQDTVEVMDIWKPVYNYKSNS